MIETKRLILREYTLQDFDAIHEIHKHRFLIPPPLHAA